MAAEDDKELMCACRRFQMQHEQSMHPADHGPSLSQQSASVVGELSLLNLRVPTRLENGAKAQQLLLLLLPLQMSNNRSAPAVPNNPTCKHLGTAYTCHFVLTG